MSGVPTPVNIVVKPFGAAAIAIPVTDPGGVTLPVPIPDQTGITPGRASFDTGFGPLNMMDPDSEGGVNPFGQDMNGILYTITAYNAMQQAGQICQYSAAASTAFTGYKVGARLASASLPGRVWVNTIDSNTNNPDVVDAGWAAEDPLTATSAPSAGTIDNLTLPGASDYALDIDTTDGDIDITGFIAQRNGQKLFLSNTGANLLRVMANNGGSATANQVRAATDLGVVQNQTMALQYFSGLSRWLAV